MATKWLPLESNPDVFNEFIEKLGVKGAKCVDVFGFDEDLLAFIPKPHLALILCYPDYKKVDELMAPVYKELADKGAQVPPNIFFMKQKISNACGTFALFHSIAQNTDKLDIGQGSFRKWFEEAQKLTVDARSNSLANCHEIAESHRNTATSGETNADPDAVEHHFITYVNVAGTLYEIDSRQSFPRDCGKTSEDTLLAVSIKLIQQTVQDAGAVAKQLMDKLGNVSFSALALVGDDN